VASQRRKVKGMNETMEPYSAQALLNAYQKIWLRCPRLCSPSQPERPGQYFSEAEFVPTALSCKVTTVPSPTPVMANYHN